MAISACGVKGPPVYPAGTNLPSLTEQYTKGAVFTPTPTPTATTNQ